MERCYRCIYLFSDLSTGYYECQKQNDFSDTEFDQYEENGCIEGCPYYEKDEDFPYFDCIHSE